jgi:uncharacterized protein (TIGR02265 family)
MEQDQEVVFQHTVEGLFRFGIPTKLTPELKALIKQEGLDLDRPLDPALPRLTWERLLELSARGAFPEKTKAEAHHAIGFAMVTGYTETFLGRAVAGVAKLIGPKRMLGRMRYNLRSATNFSEATMKALPDGAVEFWVNEPRIHPGYFAGLLYGAVQIAGGKDPKVTLITQNAEGVTYRVTWS